MNKKDCKIVQDLLPNYIDKLTTLETNEFIENHLKECKECSKIFENMKNDLNLEDEKKDKKVINFIKKYNKKMKILKLIILLIIIIYLVLLGRKAVIMINLSNTSKNIENTEEYTLYYNIYAYNFLYSLMSDKKNDQYIRMLEFTQLYNDKDTKISEYCNGKTSNYYTERAGEKKTALLNHEKGGIFPLELKDICFTQITNNKNFIKNIFRSSVVNRKSEYYISNVWLDIFGNCDLYISKSTGVITKIIFHQGYIGSMVMGDGMIDIHYKITEDDETIDEWFDEPDISEYEIVEQ